MARWVGEHGVGRRGQVRALGAPGGEAMQEVLPGQPAEVSGLRGMPQAGDALVVRHPYAPWGPILVPLSLPPPLPPRNPPTPFFWICQPQCLPSELCTSPGHVPQAGELLVISLRRA